jgi:hypothetical protein
MGTFHVSRSHDQALQKSFQFSIPTFGDTVMSGNLVIELDVCQSQSVIGLAGIVSLPCLSLEMRRKAKTSLV